VLGGRDRCLHRGWLLLAFVVGSLVGCVWHEAALDGPGKKEKQRATIDTAAGLADPSGHGRGIGRRLFWCAG